MDVVPVAATLRLRCPDCGGQLEDRIGPFWCPFCEQEVSAFTFVAALMETAAQRKAARNG